MADVEIKNWLSEVIPRHENLTATVISILESLLRANGIDYLAVGGRTKAIASALEKIARKRYKEPQKQLTDLSGIRVILYFESQVDRAARLVEKSFSVDEKNSMNRDAILSVDQIGYRSVHYVCDLGKSRTSLPEYADLVDLKFEIQLRTVLQHAWAELAHDRNYKFSGKLPRTIERQLFLYAGMLEIADKGFDSLSEQIDQYAEEVKEKTDDGDFDIEIDSVSLEEFVQKWADEAGVTIASVALRSDTSEIVSELADYGISKLKDLIAIIPPKYSELAKKYSNTTTIFGLIRDWMILHDYERYASKSWKGDWHDIGFAEDRMIYQTILGKAKASIVFKRFQDEVEED